MNDRNVRVSIILLTVVAVLVVLLTVPMSRFADDSRDMQCQVIEQAITTALLQCYALEGSYPPDLEYLQNHYGIMLDHERYYYNYEVFASNIRPQISVTARNFAE